MAGLGLNVTSDEVTLAAATPKSVLQIKAPANQRQIIKSLRMNGKQPAGGADTPIKVRMTRNAANFGTFSAAIVGKTNPSNPETPQGTYGKNATVEPTSPTDSGLWWEVQPQDGIEEFLPYDQWIEIPGGQSVQFEATSPATPTLVITATVEE